MSTSLSPYTLFSYLCYLLLCLTLSGCEKTVPEVEQNQQAASQVEVTAPDLNQICEDLKKEMQDISAQRTTFALEQINQNIRVCLPLISHAEQKKLMALSNQMYAQFLKIERTPEQQQAFEQYALDESQYPTIQQSRFEKLHIRDQYLLRHKGQAYIELDTNNPNHMHYKRNSQYLARVFAPYFPEAEKVFIQTLANQNEHSLIQEQHLSISSDEIAQRALSWEAYLKTYPKSPYRADAQYLLDVYRSLLFLGLKERPVSIQYDGPTDLPASTLTTLEQLSHDKDTDLAVQARQFLNFVNLSAEEKAELFPSSPQASAQTLLMRMLNLKLYDAHLKDNRNCFQDAICSTSSSTP